MKDYQAIIFDMDGVLIDARDWHYQALNEALWPLGLEINKEDHLARFNGLSTARKLEMLTQEQNLPSELHHAISIVKQNRTLRIAASSCYPIISHHILLSRLKAENIKIGVFTNSVRETTEFMLKSAGIFHFFNSIITNQDILNPKPDPEGYVLSMKHLGVNPEETLVVEDGHYGRLAAEAAGCSVIMVRGPSDVSLELVGNYIPGLIF